MSPFFPLPPPRIALAAALVLAFGGCNTAPLVAPDPRPTLENDQVIPLSTKREADILFVVDNSHSMRDEQDSLRDSFPRFIDKLASIEGGLPDVHIGVVSTDMGANNAPRVCRPGPGDDGRLQTGKGCGLPPGANFLVALEGGQKTNVGTSLATAFACMADLGTEGCGYEHQLGAMARALDPGNVANSGFLRPDAYLAVIFLTDEDDCSAPADSPFYAQARDGETSNLRCALAGHVCQGAPITVDGAGAFSSQLNECEASANGGGALVPVDDYVQLLKGQKSDPEKILVAAIAGWPGDPSSARYRVGPRASSTGGATATDLLEVCRRNQTSGDGAMPGLRIKSFVDQLGGTLHSICSDDFRPALEAIGTALAKKVGRRCISARPADIDPQSPGLQADCQVVLRQGGAGASRDTEASLPACQDGGPRPCWHLSPSPACTDSQLQLDVDWAGGEAPAGTTAVAKCLACANPKDARCAAPAPAPL